MLVRSTLTPGSYKTSLDTSPPPKILSLHCKQIMKVKNELDGQPSSLLTSMHVSNYNVTFSPVHLVFLELEDIHQPHVDLELAYLFLLQLPSHESLLKSSSQSKKNTMLLSCFPKAS